jgi:PKD repeat protein
MNTPLTPRLLIRLFQLMVSGGNVFSKILVLLLVLNVSSSAQAAGKIKKTYTNATAQRIKSEQDQLKQAYESNKQLFLKTNFANHTTPKIINPCKGSSKVGCEFKKVKNRAAFNYKRAVDRTKNSIAATQSWMQKVWDYIKSLFKFASRAKNLRNSLPTAGDISFYSNSSGPNARYVIQTTDDIVDPDGEVVSVTWNFDDGSSMDIPMDELDNHATIKHVFPGVGTYNISLKIYDDSDEYSEFTKQIVVTDNLVPTPNFSTTPQSGNNVDFEVIANDPENSVDHYRWDFGDGSAAEEGSTLNLVSHEFPTAGEYEVTVEVWDTAGAKADIRKLVYVNTTVPSTAKPYPIVKMDKIFGVGPLTVNFDASLSADQGNGAVASYEWDFGDLDSISNFSTLENPSHTYKKPGTYYGQVKIADSSNNTQNFNFVIFVSTGSSESPLLVAQSSEGSRTIRFNDADFLHLTTADWQDYNWDFGDNKSNSGASVQHKYAVDGAYPVRLVVRDIQGVRHVVRKNITVGQEMNAPSVAINQLTKYQSPAEIHDYSAENISPSSENQNLIYTWTLGDGTILSGENLQDISHAFSVKGHYRLSLIATNQNGLSTFIQSDVSVQEGSELRNVVAYTPKAGKIPLDVAFTANGTSSSNSTMTRYLWVFPDGSSSVDIATNKTFINTGKNWVVLFTEDALGNEDVTYSRVISYNPSEEPSNNVAPVTKFKTRFETSDPHLLTLDASSSSDDGEIVFYDWKIDDTNFLEGVIQDHIFSDGLHTVELTTTDNWGRKSSQSQKIKIGNSISVNLNIANGNAAPALNQSIIFDGSGSLVPGVDVQSYVWDFGDGSPIVKGETTQHIFTGVGNYTVKLTVTDTNGQLHFSTITIDVTTGVPPVAKMEISDTAYVLTVTNNGTYTGIVYPQKFKFSSLNSTGDRNIKHVDWDFGDGNSGFGANAEYTYFKPGNYTVVMTITDEMGFTNSSTANISISESDTCTVSEADTMCLRLENSIGSTLPFSETHWVIGHNLGDIHFSDNPEDTPAGWVKLVEVAPAVDQTAQEIDISDIVEIAEDKLLIDRDGLIKKAVNFSKPYRLEVSGFSTDGDLMSGGWSALYFGSNNLTLTTHEPNLEFIVISGVSGARRFISIPSPSSVIITDIPQGDIYVDANTADGARSRGYPVKGVQRATTLNVDLSDYALKRLKEQSLRAHPILPPRATNYSKLLENLNNIKLNPLNRVFKNNTNSRTDTSWANGLCGTAPPFPLGEPYVASTDKHAFMFFGSDNPNVYSEYSSLSNYFDRNLQLVCTHLSSTGQFQWAAWRYTDLACYPPNTVIKIPSPIVNALARDTKQIKVKYEIRDGADSKHPVITDTILTSTQEFMVADKITNRTATSKKGINSYPWIIAEGITIPDNYIDPQIRFELETPHKDPNSTDPTFYWTSCTVSANFATEAVLKRIQQRETNDTPAKNGRLSLTPAFGFFPAQYDTSTSSPRIPRVETTVQDENGNPVITITGGDVNIFKASYKVVIDNKNRPINWTTVNATYVYGGNQSPVIPYTFHQSAPGSGEVEGYFTLDAENIDNLFTFDQTHGGIQVNLEFIGTYATDHGPETVTISGRQLNFTALFNAKLPDSDGPICSQGKYGGEVSSYGRSTLLSFLKLHNSLPIKCNDFSLPFGGPFSLNPTWKHDEHRYGLQADIRTINSDLSAQDSYDSDNASVRRGDLTTYMNFSKRLLQIAASADPGPLYTLPTTTLSTNVDRKMALLNFCNISSFGSVIGCDAGTTFSNLDHLKILQICQFNVGNTPADVCTASTDTTTFEKIKRFSNWLEVNTLAWDTLIRDGGKVMHTYGGYLKTNANISIDTAYGPWTKNAFIDGKWPRATASNSEEAAVLASGEPIYQYGTSTFVPVQLGCPYLGSAPGCTLSSGYQNGKKVHYHHLHITVNQGN